MTDTRCEADRGIEVRDTDATFDGPSQCSGDRLRSVKSEGPLQECWRANSAHPMQLQRILVAWNLLRPLDKVPRFVRLELPNLQRHMKFFRRNGQHERERPSKV